MIVVDSSFLVSFFLEDDANYSRATRILEEHQEEETLLPDIILFETLTVLDYRQGMGKAREAYDMLRTTRRIRIFQFSEEDRPAILREFFEAGGKLSVADASVTYLAKKTGSKALAFDEGILRALAKK